MKDCFDNESISVMFNYVNELGDTLTRSETVQISDDFPIPMDIISMAAESFLKDIGAIRNDSVYFVDELTDDEFEAVTDVLREMRGERSAED